jgi:hypothetical protein
MPKPCEKRIAVSKFIEQRLVPTSGAFNLHLKLAHETYLWWAEKLGLPAISGLEFRRLLKELQVEFGKARGHYWLLNYELIPTNLAIPAQKSLSHNLYVSPSALRRLSVGDGFTFLDPNSEDCGLAGPNTIISVHNESDGMVHQFRTIQAHESGAIETVYLGWHHEA